MKHEIERRADTEGDRQELIDYAEARAQALSGWPITEDHHLDIQCDDGRLVYVGPAAQAPLWALVAYLSLRIAELTSPPLGSEAAADGDASPAPPEGIAHEWRFDTIIGHYRCNRCLARDDGSHGPTCPKAILPDPPVQP
jgi:hypothetical protein